MKSILTFLAMRIVKSSKTDLIMIVFLAIISILPETFDDEFYFEDKKFFLLSVGTTVIIFAVYQVSHLWIMKQKTYFSCLIENNFYINNKISILYGIILLLSVFYDDPTLVTDVFDYFLTLLKGDSQWNSLYEYVLFISIKPLHYFQYVINGMGSNAEVWMNIGFFLHISVLIAMMTLVPSHLRLHQNSTYRELFKNHLKTLVRHP